MVGSSSQFIGLNAQKFMGTEMRETYWSGVNGKAATRASCASVRGVSRYCVKHGEKH